MASGCSLDEAGSACCGWQRLPPAPPRDTPEPQALDSEPVLSCSYTQNFTEAWRVVVECGLHAPIALAAIGLLIQVEGSSNSKWESGVPESRELGDWKSALSGWDTGLYMNWDSMPPPPTSTIFNCAVEMHFQSTKSKIISISRQWQQGIRPSTWSFWAWGPVPLQCSHALESSLG